MYKKCSQRLEKAKIVSDLLIEQQNRCPNGGAFVKYDGERWWELSEHDARENITAAFRNRLHENYTSSSKFKSAKRRMMQLKVRSEDRKDNSVVVKGNKNNTGGKDDGHNKISMNKKKTELSGIIVGESVAIPVPREGNTWDPDNTLEGNKKSGNCLDIIQTLVQPSFESSNLNKQEYERVKNDTTPTLISSLSSHEISSSTLFSTTKNEVKGYNDSIVTVSSSECEDNCDSSMDSCISTPSSTNCNFSSSGLPILYWDKNKYVDPMQYMNKWILDGKNVNSELLNPWSCCLPPAVMSIDSLFSPSTSISIHSIWLLCADQSPFPQEEDLLEPVDPSLFEEPVTTN